MGGGGDDMDSMMQMMMQMFGKGKGGGKGGWGQSDRFKVLPKNVDRTVWIGNIPEGITWKEMQENFGGAGNCKRVEFTKNGQGFALFETAEEAKKCISMFNGCDINGSKLEVDVWESKKD